MTSKTLTTEPESIELAEISPFYNKAQSTPDAVRSINDEESAAMYSTPNEGVQPKTTATTTTTTTQSPEDENDIPYPTGSKFHLTILTLIAVLILVSLDINVLATAVPAITDHFHSVTDIGWYSASYRLMSCSFQFLFSKLYTLYPIKRIYLASVTLFLIGSTVCATTTTTSMLIVGRAICGLACAGATQGTFTIMIYAVPLSRRAYWNGFLGALEQVVAIGGPILGGLLTQRLSWRWCFWISLPIGAVALVLLVAFVPSASDTRSSGGNRRTELEEQQLLPWKEKLRRLDLIGTLLFVPSMTSLFLVLGWAGTQYAWTSPVVIGLLITFAILLAGFLYDQHSRGDEATIPLRLIKDRNIIAAFIFSLTCMSSMDIIEYYLPTYFQAVHGFSASRSGYMLLPLIGGCMLGMLIGGTGTSWWGYYTPFMLATSILLPIANGLMTTWKVHTGLAKLISYPGFVGFGACLGLQAPQVAVQRILSASADEAALGIAVVMFAQNFGPALFISLAQTVFAARLQVDLERLHVLGSGGGGSGRSGNDTLASIENLGLTDLSGILGPQKLDSALLGFDEALRRTWYLAVGFSCVTIVGSLLMQWRSVKEKTN